MLTDASTFSELPQPCLVRVAEILAHVPVYDLHASRVLLRSFYYPELSSHSSIRDSISTLERYIDTLKSAISKYPLAMAVLQSRLDNVISHLSFQSSFLAPIRRLPDELLMEIFIHACQEPIDVSRHTAAVLNIEEVCVRWREVARSIPALWTSFDVYGGRPTDAHTNIVVSRIQKCIKFSADLPLSIGLPKFRRAAEETGPMSVIYRQLYNNSYRWKSLRIDVEVLMDLAILLHKLCIVTVPDMGQLRKLELVSSHLSRPPYHLFEAATALEEVTLIGSHPPSISHAFPWANVKKLHIEGLLEPWHWDDFLYAFRTMPSLEEFIWKQNEWVLDEGDTLTEVTLPSLRSFTIQQRNRHAVSDPWTLFRMPSLTHLQFINDMKDYDEILSMIQLSECGVKSLTFEDCTADFFESIVIELSNIEEISLVNVHESVDILSDIVWGTNSPILLRSLRRIHLTDGRGSTEYIQETAVTLKAIMKSRYKASLSGSRPGVSPLEVVKWTFSNLSECDVDRQPLDSLKELGRKLGIDVELDFVYSGESANAGRLRTSL